jgi:hypothetical protein
MEEGCLLLLRVDDGSRRRGILMDRAGPKARVLSEHDGVVILAAVLRPCDVDDFLARLAGFDVAEVVRSETLRVASGANRDLEVVS